MRTGNVAGATDDCRNAAPLRKQAALGAVSNFGVIITPRKAFGETDDIRFYLIYEPTLQFLESNASALDGARAEQIAKACKETGKSAYVYAPQKFISQKELTSMGITFCQLPYNIHRISDA